MTRTTIRCAIYTRKSSDDGLDQDFHSLDAQHEACAAYSASQKHEGWKMLADLYDDGGISGGSLERPALQRLLGEIDAGRIDMVVVYKIDRLTRSLADFARLVERLEAEDCSFVSVTQAFNTSSSMGRLTLNVLLSFAQFEREVTGERIRDKIAASKKKGLWMGGLCPLGYDPHPDKTCRELVVNRGEAATVCKLFDLYLENGSLSAVNREADRLGLRSKRHEFSTGRVQGGNIMSQGQVHRILTNPVYVGQIRHKSETYDGTHEAIIDPKAWSLVQTRLQDARARRRGPAPGHAVEPSAPLKGKVRDETGDLLTPTHTQRRGRRHRYYVSNRLISGRTDTGAWRLPARELEKCLAAFVAQHLEDCAARHELGVNLDIATTQSISIAASGLVSSIKENGVNEAAPLIRSAQLVKGEIRIELDAETLSRRLDRPDLAISDRSLSFMKPLCLRRRGVETKLIAGEFEREPDQTLVQALRNAHAWAGDIRAGTAVKNLAKSKRVCPRHMSRTIHLTGLSPKIQTAILKGGQPVDLTLQRLRNGPIPLDWQEQEHVFGFS